MKIIIVGGGKVGHQIGKKLTNEKHDVVIIDDDLNRSNYEVVSISILERILFAPLRICLSIKPASLNRMAIYRFIFHNSVQLSGFVISRIWQKNKYSLQTYILLC